MQGFSRASLLVVIAASLLPQGSTRPNDEDYNAVCRNFVTEYYRRFDDPATRGSLIDLYHPTDSFLTFDGEQFEGAARIVGKLKGLPFETVNHGMANGFVDCQPLHDTGILIQVNGQLLVDGAGNPLSFVETFVLRPSDGAHISYLIHRDIFRLHN